MILGYDTKVTYSPNHSIIGLNGTIVDETKHMLILETAKGRCMIPKRGAVILVDGQYIHGEEMYGRMHERLTGP